MIRKLLLISLLLITTTAYADNIGGNNIHGSFPPLGFQSATQDLVRPRTVNIDNTTMILSDNGDGSISIASRGGSSGGYTNLTQFTAQTPWRTFYSNGSGIVTELALGANGTYLKSNGATSVPTFDTPSGAGTVTSVSQGTGVTCTPNPITGIGTIAIGQDVSTAASPTFANITATNTATASVVDTPYIEYGLGNTVTVRDALTVNGTITGNLTGNVTGNATTATTATTATNATNVTTTQVSNSASYYPLFVSSSTNGNQACDLGTGLTYNPSTNILSTTSSNLSNTATSNVVDTKYLEYSSGGNITIRDGITISTPSFISGEKFSKTFTITNPTAAKYFKGWRCPVATTITAVHLNCSGNVVVGQLWQFDSNGLNGATVDSSDITGVVDTNVNDDGSLSAAAITAENYVGWHTTSVTGTPTYAYITFEGYYN